MPPRRRPPHQSTAAKFIKLFLLLGAAFAFKLFLSWAVRNSGLLPARTAVDELADPVAGGGLGDAAAADATTTTTETLEEEEKPAGHGSDGEDDDTPETPAEFVDRTINENRVVIFSKSYCPYSMRGKEVMRKHLGERGVAVVELDGMDGMGEMQDELQKLTGGRTVPRIFVDGRFIGGANDVSALDASGQLETLLREAGLVSDGTTGSAAAA